MKNVLKVMGIIFGVIATVSMIKLWSWNVEENGWVFALAMIMLAISFTVALIFHTFDIYNKIKKK